MTAEERIQKANGGRENSKGEPRRMELEVVEVGRWNGSSGGRKNRLCESLV